MVSYIKDIILYINNCRDNLQCSELCGVQHGFMPIVIEVVNINDYIEWLKAYETT